MNEIEIELLEWCKEINAVHLPRWHELPELDLYMDQVVTFIEKHLNPIRGNGDNRIITPAMINNYVKLKLIPPPVKKRYTRFHIAYLIAITILKQVITIQEVKDGVDFQALLLGERDAFNSFCQEQEYALQKIASSLLEAKSVAKEPEITINNVALKMTTLAFASKMLAEKAVLLQKTKMSKGEL